MIGVNMEVVASSQGAQVARAAGKGQEIDPPLEPPEGTQPR